MYFKVVFKGLYPDEYAVLADFQVSYESLLLKVLVDSFASLFEPVYYNLYQDFKGIYKMLFHQQEKHLNVLKVLDELGITFSSLIDILFVIATLCFNIEYIQKSVKVETLAS